MSAQKQCPKCGEKNPAEAVMCWACYTSLTGGGTGAAALAGAGGPSLGGSSSPMTDSAEKKSIDPKQLAIIGVGLLVALGFGVKTMMGGGEESSDFPALPTSSGDTPKPQPASNPNPASVPVNGVAVPLPPVSGNGGGQAAPAQGYFRVVVSPNPRQKWGTAAIVPTQSKADKSAALSYAVMAKQHIDQTTRFSAVEIYVINDAGAASTLRAYQSKSKGAPLTESDYTNPALSNVWNNAILRYVWNNGKSTVTYPFENPNNFWSSDKTASSGR